MTQTPSVNLLPPEYRRDRYRPHLTLGALAGAVALAMVVWAAVLVGQLVSVRYQIADVGQAMTQHAAAFGRYQEVKRLESELAGMVGKAGKPAVLRSDVMREALRLGTDVRVTGVNVAGDGTVTISGSADRLTPVAAYLERVGRSKLIAEPALTTSARDALTGDLRFEIVGRVGKGGGQ